MVTITLPIFYLYDGFDVAQEQIAGSPSTNYLLGGGTDERFARTDGTGTTHYLTDALGSTLALSNGTGAVQTSYTYEPYGATTQIGTGSANPARYTGREEDGTGLYYYRARYYDPRRQRFVSEDPMGFADGANPFSYVAGRPTQFRDPFGLSAEKCGKRKCKGKARVLEGNADHVGKKGGFAPVVVAAGSAAVIPTQFADSKGDLRPHIGDISATTADGDPLFDGITEVVGGDSPIPGVPVRDALQQLFPDALIIELPTGEDMGTIEVTIWVPDKLACPKGTTEVK